MVINKLGIMNFKSYLIGGIVLGGLSPLIFVPVFGFDIEWWVYFTGAIFGLMATVIFCHLSVKSFPMRG